MVVLAAAVVPHPPLLVPDLAAGAADLVAPLLVACDRVVAGLLARSPRAVVLFGSGRQTRAHRGGHTGTLAGFGAPWRSMDPVAPRLGGSAAPVVGSAHAVGVLPAPDTRAVDAAGLPLSLAIGRWLVGRAGWTEADGSLLLQELAVDAPTEQCVRLGTELAAQAGPDSVWLALGDGSTRRGPRSPGHDDPRAAGFDAAAVAAFAAGDPAALLALDPQLAAELGAAGRPVWQALAAAVAADPGWPGIDARVHYDDAPFGVEYLVADWQPRR